MILPSDAYVQALLKGNRSKEVKEAILRSPLYSVLYAFHVDRHPSKETWLSAKQDDFWKSDYLKKFDTTEEELELMFSVYGII